MGISLKSFIGFALIALVILCLAGCGFDGKVFVYFIWEDANVPDNFTTTIPNVPSNISLLQNGQPYLTLPGTFTVSIDYGPVNHTKIVVLESGVAIVGKEDFYYNIVLNPAGITFSSAP
jgi:hypothetical protein